MARKMQKVHCVARSRYIWKHLRNSVVPVCCEEVSVIGMGDARDLHPNIFTRYFLETGLVNGKEHYTSQDGTIAIAFNQEKRMWVIQKGIQR